MIFTEEQTRSLAKADHYRNFLKKAFTCLEGSRSGFSYASFTRKAGFSSRSFPREVVLGKKRLSAGSALAFADALELKGELRRFFLLSVDAENRSDGNLKSRAEKQLLQSKNRILSKGKNKGAQAATPFQCKKHWFEVYAALGTQMHGATFAEIIHRTRLPEEICRSILQTMLESNAISFVPDTHRYHPKSAHLILDALKEDAGFKSIYLDRLKEIQKQAETRFNSDEELFFNSAFAISENKMKQFRSELRELLLQFVDQTENPHGDRIAKITLAFTL